MNEGMVIPPLGYRTNDADCLASVWFDEGGLTKRELLIIENHAQGFRFVIRAQKSSREIAKLAIAHADALIEELKKDAKD